jgi:restriction system protein
VSQELDLSELKTAARDFIALQSQTAVASLYGVTDGKAVGTYVEQAFRTYLTAR